MGKVKKWEDLDLSRKVELLNHWYYYYGNEFITFEEWDNFGKFAETHADNIFDFIMTSFLSEQHTIQTGVLVRAMRMGIVDELFNVIVKYGNMSDEEKKAFDPVRCTLLDELETTYKDPQPPVPMNGVIVVEEEGPGFGGKN